jgi:hypothetical protein
MKKEILFFDRIVDEEGKGGFVGALLGTKVCDGGVKGRRSRAGQTRMRLAKKYMVKRMKRSFSSREMVKE